MKKTTWFELGLEVNKDKEVYILGKDGIWYGPYRVHNHGKKELVNKGGSTFMHYLDEDLYTKENPMDKSAEYDGKIKEINEHIKVQIYDILTCEFNSIGISHFLGGSRRFGYEDWNSDVDIFVPSPMDQIELINLKKFICDLGFKRKLSTRINADHADIDSNYPGIVFELHNYVHLVVISEYSKICAEHLALEYFIKANPFLIDIAKNLKKHGVKGAVIYRHLQNYLKYVKSSTNKKLTLTSE